MSSLGSSLGHLKADSIPSITGTDVVAADKILLWDVSASVYKFVTAEAVSTLDFS